MWIYKRAEPTDGSPGTFIVGYLSQGCVQHVKAYQYEHEAMQMVNYLNGGTGMEMGAS